MPVATVEKVIDDVVENHNKGRWIIESYNLGTWSQMDLLGVKAFGKWVQRLEYRGLKRDVPGQKTKKAFRAEVEKVIAELIKSGKERSRV